ncbi:uncharacterized protein BROUX77_004377 [Berkeleyomyces rouxiae]|uniref:uncharacterized protein n=1 Tax=Berkeleyomyces rouxiae TaxID=2035830 RepID=UPI003B81C13A
MLFSLFVTLASATLIQAGCLDKLYNNRGLLQVYHSGTDTGYSVAKVLATAFDFLAEHPSETLIIRVNNDGMRYSDDEIFERYMTEYLKSDKPVCKNVKDRLYITIQGTVFWAPTMGELRGKVLLLEDFVAKIPGSFGMPWKSSGMAVTDGKFTITRVGVFAKWHNIQSDLQEASKDNMKKLFVTHTTVTIGSTPIHAAAGKSSKKGGLNDRLGEYLKAGKVERTGIVVMDFPGKELVEQIIGCNYLMS